MKKIILILSAFLVLGCSVRRSAKKINNESELINTINDSNKNKIESENNIKSIINVSSKSELINTNEKTIDLIGKVQPSSPLILYDIINGDTLNYFKVTGSADVIYKTSAKVYNSALNNNIQNNTETRIENTENIKESNSMISSKVKEIKTKTEDIVKKDFSFGTYVIFFIWGFVFIALCVLFYG